MSKFIELTCPTYTPLGQRADEGKRAIINVDDISEVISGSHPYYPEAKSAVTLRSMDSSEEAPRYFEESYDSIIETLRKAGVKVLTVVPVEDNAVLQAAYEAACNRIAYHLGSPVDDLLDQVDVEQRLTEDQRKLSREWQKHLIAFGKEVC